MEQCSEFRSSPHLFFDNFEKLFNVVNREGMWNPSPRGDIPEKLMVMPNVTWYIAVKFLRNVKFKAEYSKVAFRHQYYSYSLSVTFSILFCPDDVPPTLLKHLEYVDHICLHCHQVEDLG